MEISGIPEEMTYPYQNHDDMDIHELHNSHSSNLPAIIIIFSKTALPYTLWLFNIAMENGPFIDGLPIKNGDFPWLC